MLAFNVYAADQCDPSSPWGYGATNGPACWGEMDFNLCAEGREQSPINIRTNDDDDDDGGNDDDDGLPPLDFSGYGTDVALECSGPVNCGEEEAVQHNGETIKAHLPKPLSDNTLQIGSVQYDLKEFHFHQRSEHRIDGMSYPMESHIVHVASDGSGSLAVVGVFIKEGAKHDELAKIWDDLPREKGDVVEVGSFNLKKLLPSNLASYRYDGSLTTPTGPDCAEIVDWVVLAKPITLSKEQIDAFRDFFDDAEEFPSGNRRPVQPLHGRVVETDVDDDDKDDDKDD